MNSTGISRVWHYGLQRKRNVANRCDRGSKSYDANQKRKHLPGFGVLPGVPGEAAESMFERRGHGQLLKKFGSYPDGRLPSGKKEKADANVSLLEAIRGGMAWREKINGPWKEPSGGRCARAQGMNQV
jgi:hypothetical protein